jgi:hypothetical protein
MYLALIATINFVLLFDFSDFRVPESPPERLELLRKVQVYRPNTTDFRWQEIPWHTDAENALKQAREEKRPLFVWLAGGRDRDGTPLERC